MQHSIHKANRMLLPILFLLLILGLTSSHVQSVSTVRINAGTTSSFTDSNGVTWAPDGPYQNGYGAVSYIGGDVAGTVDDTLFYTDRTANNRRTPLKYTFKNMDNGEYTCNLYFAEMLPAAQAISRRVFHVLINNQQVATSLDIFNEVGAKKMLVKSFDCAPVNGVIDVSFGFFIGRPKVNAIEIVKKTTPTIPDTLPGIATYYYDYNTTNEMLDKMPIPFNRKPVIGIIEHEPFFKAEDYTLFRNARWENQFAVAFHFYLDVEQEGLYKFQTLSNDGTILYCNDFSKPIFSNDYNHDMVAAVVGQVQFRTGQQKCILYFYQSIHRSGFDVRWMPPGETSFIEIPVSAMSYAPSEAAPVIHSITPATAKVGDTVQITGFGFQPTSGQNVVITFGNIATIPAAITDAEHMTVVVPPRTPAGQISVTVKTSIDTSNAATFASS